MRITVKAKTRSARARLRKIDETTYMVAVREPAADDRANYAIQKALAEYFGVAPSLVLIVHGKTSQNKVFEINKG